MIRLNALSHLLDPVGQKGNLQPFDLGYTKLSTGEYITGRCVCLSRNLNIGNPVNLQSWRLDFL